MRRTRGLWGRGWDDVRVLGGRNQLERKLRYSENVLIGKRKEKG